MFKTTTVKKWQSRKAATRRMLDKQTRDYEAANRFLVVCPRCGKQSEVTGKDHPRVNCGDCLMNDVEIVEMKILDTKPVTP